MSDDIVYDEMLGELRTSDVSGGTGGKSYVAGDGIAINGNTISATGGGGTGTVTGIDASVTGNTATISATGSTTSVNLVGIGGTTVSEGENGEIQIGGGGGGEGTVTGIEASVSGGTATIEATGSTTSVKFVGKDGVLVQGNTNGEVEFGVPAVSKHAVFSNSAATLAANTELVAVDHCANMKNDYVTFFANFETFDTLKISQMYGNRGKYFIINATTIKVYNNDGTLWNTYTHGLTLSSFVYVLVAKKNSSNRRSHITIMTEGGSYTINDTLFYGDAGPLTAVATAAMTNVQFELVVTDAQCPVWVFGDSYIEFAERSWSAQFCNAGHTGVLFCGYGGLGSNTAVLSFNALIAKAIPRYVVWAIGMNDPDSSSAISANWKNVADYLIEKCNELGIVLIFCTCPNTPTTSNIYKNAYIKASGHRYVDFAKAVNAESAGSTWYPGMLGPDNLHCTVLGGEALMHQFIQDCPESVLFEDNQLPIVAGKGVVIFFGSTVSQADWLPVTEVTGNSVTVSPNNAYVVNAATKTSITINSAEVPAGSYGVESHLEIFLGLTNNVVAGANVIFADPLQVESVNDCLIRFHDGKAIISIEDHVPGYVTTVSSGTTSGSIYYGLATSPIKYVGFSSALDGTVVDLAGVVTSAGEKHIIGNGYTSSLISGNISCTSGLSAWKVGLQDVSILGGTMTLVDAYIPSGATVFISSGAVDIRNLYGAGTLDFNHRNITGKSQAPIYASGITFTGGSAANGNGGAFQLANTTAEFVSCTFVGNSANTGGALYDYAGANLKMTGCVISGNTAGQAGGLFCDQGVFSSCTISGNTAVQDFRFTSSAAVISAYDCTLGIIHGSRGRMILDGQNNTIQTILGNATVQILSGTSINLTSQINTGAVVVSAGGCTVNGVEISGGTYTKITSVGGSASGTLA